MSWRGRVEVEEEEKKFGHDLTSRDVSWFLVCEEEGCEGDERVGRAGSDGGGTEGGGGEGFDAAEEFVEELVVVLFFSGGGGVEERKEGGGCEKEGKGRTR